MQEWEYLVVRVLPDGRWVGWEHGVWREWKLERVDDVASQGLRTLSSEEQLLKQLGSRGWELTGVVSSLVVNIHRLYFKRPVRAGVAEPRVVPPQSLPVGPD